MDIISFVNQTAFYIGAIFVAVSCLVYTVIHINMEKPQTKIFIMTMWIMILTSLFNMAAIYAEPYCQLYRSAQTVLYVSNYLYFALHNMLAMFVCYYVFFATQTFSRMTAKWQTIYMIPFLISEFFVLTNPINHFSWYYDESFRFHRNWGEASVYITGGFYYIVAIYYLLFRWYAATRKRKIMIIVSFLMTVLGVLIQYFVPSLEVELLFDTITFWGLMLSVEYDDDRVDSVTRMYNRGAFLQDVSYYLDTHTNFYVVLLKFTNMDTYQKMPDSFNINEIFESASSAIRGFFQASTCYRVTPSSIIMLVLNRDEEYTDRLAGKVDNLLKSGVGLPKRDERIAGIVIQVKAPEEVSTIQDLLLLCEMDYRDVTTYAITKGRELHEFFERAEIERAIRSGIEKNSFEVVYQKVYNTKDKTVHSAEALIRLNDPTLGQLLPERFIYAAERNGMIDIISDFVIREVCGFIKSGIPDKLGMKYINVNLSVLQCMQSHFVEQVIGIVKEEGVEPSKISFEIIETVAAEDYGYLANVVKRCKELGFRFSMEGYGTGYSNIYAFFSLEFDEIKFDKSMLWEAGRSEQGRIIFENSVRMVHEMGLPVVSVGVETKEQFEFLEKMDVELVQGFYFSRPEP